MANNYFDIYLEQVFALAETLVIKSVASANGINNRMRQLYGAGSVDPGRPESWKYYLNLAGEYHPIDTKMSVISMDTLQLIEFNKSNLAVHKATASAYQYGTRQYLELVNKYPTQENLILGVLYPCNLDIAIDAEEGTILSYNKALVEFNEYTFIDKLQRWISVYLQQHYNPQYSVSDELFNTSVIGQMYMAMIPAILNIRLRACRSNEAHSYHVRRYLASHGFLDDYLDHLTTKQALWFYRNINYIEKYSGHQDTFNWLIDHVLTERDIPIGEYNMIHDTGRQPNGIIEFDESTVEDNLYPTLRFDKTNLNPVASTSDGVSLTLDAIFTKEDKLTTENERFHSTDIVIAKKKMENSLSNKLKTKVLESSMYDYSDSQTIKLSDTLVNQWILRAFNNTYKAVIVANNPLTGESIPLTSREALYLLYYCYMRGAGWNDVLYIPDFSANRVPRDPLPDTSDIRKHVPWDRISRKSAQLALDLMPATTIAYSIEAFYNDCAELTDAANQQFNLVSVYEDLMDRGYAENMINRIYCIRTFKQAEQIRFDNWLSEKSIYLDAFKQEDYQLMYTSLLAAGTGTSLSSTTSVRALQRAMINLFAQLSSYSIQFITDINQSSIRQMNGNRVRVGDRKTEVNGIVYVDTVVDVEDVQASVGMAVDYDSNKIDATDDQDAKVHSNVDFELPDLFDKTDGIHYGFHLNVPITLISISHNYGTYPNKYNISPTWLGDDLLNMTEGQAYDLVDIYQRDLGCSLRGDNKLITISRYWTNKKRNGFHEDVISISSYFAQTKHHGFKDLSTYIPGDWQNGNHYGFSNEIKQLKSVFTNDKHHGFTDINQYLPGGWKEDNHLGFAEDVNRLKDDFADVKRNGFKEEKTALKDTFSNNKHHGFKNEHVTEVKNRFTATNKSGFDKESATPIENYFKTRFKSGFTE